MMKRFPSVFLGVFLIMSLVSGCATVQELKEDVQSAVEAAERALFSSEDGGMTSTPSVQCEPFYGKRKDSHLRYRACLKDAVEVNMSPDDLDRFYFGKAFQKCLPIYKSQRADWQEYRKCQGDEGVRMEVDQLVRWRSDIARRDAARQPRSVATRRLK